MNNGKLIMDNGKAEFEAELQEEARFNLLMIGNFGKAEDQWQNGRHLDV